MAPAARDTSAVSPAGAPAAPEPRDETLARRLARGDEVAAVAVRERVGRIVAFRGFAIPGEDRRDIQQEVVTQVWQAVRRPDFDFGRGFWGFVETVTVRRCIDWLRAQRPRESLDDRLLEGASTQLQSLLRSEQVQLAHAVLARLDRPCRELIYLHAGMQRSYRDLAPLLNRSEGALRVQLHRCIKRARALVDELGEAVPERAVDR